LKKVFFLLVIFAINSCNYEKKIKANKGGSTILSQGFDSIPFEARPRALWTWVDGNFDKESITTELEEAKAKGMGGFDIWDVNHVQDEEKAVPKGQPFMNDEYTDAIVHTIKEATRIGGLDIGLIVASGWNAGGSWTKPENATMRIYNSEKIITGPCKLNNFKIPFPDIAKLMQSTGDRALIQKDSSGKPVYYKEIEVLAYPVNEKLIIADPNLVLDLSGKMDKDGNLTWDAPAGKWKIVRMICANTGQPMIQHTPSSKGPMIDHFNPKATEVHIQYFIDKLLKGLGTFEGKALKYLYSDSYEIVGQLWTPNMLEEFKTRMGYDITPFIPVFEGYTVINQDVSKRFLYDYAQVLSDLIIDSHYLNAKKVCNKYGIGYVAEAAGPGKPIHNCPFESLKSSGSLTYPRGEFWHNKDITKKDKDATDRLQVIKGVASASHIYNQKYVEAESFTSVHLWQESLSELKPVVDRAFCEGLNRIYFHTFPHVPKAAGTPGWIYGFGTQVSVNQPWWNMSKPFMEYLGRCSYMLQQGNFVGDVLYYYGDEAPNFVPAKATNPSLGFGYDYDVTNSDIILNKLSVNNGKLALPHGQEYSVMVLPKLEEMNLKVLVKLEKLIAEGAIVIGPKPTKSTGYFDYKANDQKVVELANKIWGACDGKTVTENTYGKGKVYWGIAESKVLASINVPEDFKVISAMSLDSVDYIHRKTENEEIYFVCNRTSRPKTFKSSFRVTGKTPQLWDPMTNEKSTLDFIKDSNYTTIDIELEPYGSTFVVFGNNVSKLPLRAILNPNMKATITDTIKAAWQLDFQNNYREPKSINLTSLIDLSNSTIDGVKYFSGTTRYTTTYHTNSSTELADYQIFMDLGNVGIVASVTLNGQNLGIRWKAPYLINVSDVLKSGNNIIQIDVANRWANKMVGDSKLPKPERVTQSNITRLPTGWSYPLTVLPNEAYLLPTSGLTSPVKLYFIKNKKN